MSKANRRRQRAGNRPPTAGGSAAPPPKPTGSTTPSGASASGGSSTGGPGPVAAGAGRPPAGGTPRPTGTAPRPSSAARHGRRERQRLAYKPSFMERYRTAIVVVAALAVVALVSVFVFFSASQPAYACSTIWAPAPTSSPAASATPNLGYVQPDMGRQHVPTGEKVTYTYCAPASGPHYQQPAAPIAARVYGPGDSVIPQGWIHNLEHGGLVLLYQGTSAGATTEGQAQLRAFYEAFPPTVGCGPVVARFDQMSTPFQAIVWGRVLLMDTFDPAQVMAFWNQWGGRSNPEKLCPTPNSATPAPSAAPSGSVGPSPSIAPSSSAVPSTSPAPSASLPAASPVPSASAAPSAS